MGGRGVGNTPVCLRPRVHAALSGMQGTRARERAVHVSGVGEPLRVSSGQVGAETSTSELLAIELCSCAPLPIRIGHFDKTANE